MNRRIAVLSALTLSLLLSACSKDKDDAVTGDAQAETSAQVQDDDAPAGEAPAPQLKYWPLLGPMVAGSYTGACMRTPGTDTANVTITVGADGKAAANGLAIDFRDAHNITLQRMDNGKGGHGTSAMFHMISAQEGAMTLSGIDGTASIERDDKGFLCTQVAATGKLNTQPLHQVLASLVNGKKQTLSCGDIKNPLVRRDADVEIDGSVIKVGDASFDMKLASTETVNIDDAGRSMTLILVMPDARSVQLAYDGAGKLGMASARNTAGSTLTCASKE